MRWWLAALFAVFAALTALLVAQVASRQADAALRDRAEELTAGNALAAAVAVRQALERGNLGDAVAMAAERRRITLYVYDSEPFQRFDTYSAAETQAQSSNRGVWASCDGDFHSEQ